MALVLGPLPLRIGITVRDRDGNESEAVTYRTGLTTVVDMEAQVQAFAAVVAAITNGFIVGATVSIPFVENAPPTELPPEASEVSRKGRFVFNTDIGRTATYDVPSIDPALVTDNNKGGAIDPAQAAVVAYTTYMNTSVNGSNVGIGTLREAYKANRRTNRG